MRCYFLVRFGDGRELEPSEEVRLPDDGAAREFALRVMRQMIEDGGCCDDPEACMVVRDDAGREVCVIPFPHTGRVVH
jgi:uncharacterized protein DUF6894